ncbi:hypothetical protein RF11_07616 [Thelohanellus kitauei]|uniref:Uncharacterized protein n=1 Tax=Thelohanellus kitauei TaxID=669202 RepID=A0A0C2NME7_THEKT|nr:hypothetical protein RF11_07616 [Thelohanellus kitauei]
MPAIGIKIDTEHRVISKKWKRNYFIIDHSDKPTCLICLQQITVAKDVEETTVILKKINNIDEDAVRASPCHIFSLSFRIKTVFRRRDDKEMPKQAFPTIIQPRNTIASRVVDVARDLDSFKKNDDNTDITGIAQIAGFICGVDKHINTSEEFVELTPIKDTIATDDNPIHFQTLKFFLSDTGSVNDVHAQNYSHKNSALRNEFTRFADFKLMKNSFGIVRSPFSINTQAASEELQMKLIDIQYDSIVKDNLGSLNSGAFYTFTGQR